MPSPELFFNKGNQPALDEVKYLRIAQILSVDTTNMMANIVILDKTSQRANVPLPLPMVYPGGGILAVPARGAHVMVGIRAMQMPIILGYYPMNTMAPDSYFQMFKQVYGIPETLQEGEIYIRARGDSAKCLVCNTISPIVAWEANLDTTTLIEQCPANNCNAPAVIMDPATRLPVPNGTNKQILGSTLRITPQAQFSFQTDNIMSAEKGDTTNIFKLFIDGKTGDVTFKNARDIKFQSSGDFYVGCNNFTVKADNSITETTQNKNFNTNQNIVEGSQDRVFTATRSLTFQAQTLSDQITGFMSQSMSDRTLSIVGNSDGSGGTDSYEAKSATIFIRGDRNNFGRLTQIGLVDGSTTNTISDELDLYGAEIRSVYGTSTVTVVGAATASYTNNFGLTVGGNLSQSVTGSWTGTSASANLTATGAFNIHGTNLIFNSGTKAVARVDDTVVISSSTDAAFINYFTLLKSFLDSFVLAFNAHGHSAFNTPPSVPFVVPVDPPVPTTATGKITTGNTTVLA